jgi:hypothetical protein
VKGMHSFLIPLFSILAVIAFYPWLIIYLCLLSGLGVFTWLIVFGMLTPIITFWYYITKKRMVNYLRLLMDNEPKPWDMEKALSEYEELLKKRN